MVYLTSLETILNYVSWEYFFLLLLLGGIIGGIFALIRGIYRTTCKYIVEGILIIILVLCMPGIVNWVSSIDFSSMFSFSFNVDNTSITFTSVDQTVVDVLVAKGINSSSNPALYLSSISLVHSILGLAFYIVGMILVMLITPILTWLVYLLTFMIFVSKERRKNKKHRFIASIEGFVCGVVIACLFIAPFSSLVNIASQASSELKNNSSGDQVSESDFNTLIEFLSKYQDSAFYTALSFGSKDSSKALDTKVMTQVSEVTINGTKTSIYNEIGEIIKIFSSCGDSLKVDISNDGKISISLETNTLLSPDTISSLLNNLSSWETFLYLVPALAQIGNNIDQIESIGLDLSNISWSDTVSNINQIYKALYDAGLIDFYVVPLVKGDTVPNYFIIDISKKDNYKEAINKLLDNGVVANNLPYILYNASKSDQFSYLSSSLDTYKSLNYKNIFSNLVDFLFYTCNSLGVSELYFDNVNSFTSQLIEKIKLEENNDTLKALLSGGEITITDNDQASQVTYEGLLSNELFSSNIIDFPKFLTSTLTSVESVSKYLTEEDLISIGQQIKEKGLKEEVKNIVGMMTDILKLVDDIQAKGSIDFGDEETRNNISNVLIKSKQSSIITKILPKVIKRMLTENASSLESNLYGLKVTDFDFEPVDENGDSIFIDECNDLIEIAKYAQDLSKQIDGKSDTASMLESIDTATLQNLLVGIISNKIINPNSNITGIEADYQTNYNFNKIIKGIFKQDSLKDMGFILADDLSSITWLGEDGEIKNIVNIIDFCKLNPDFFGGDLSLDEIEPSQIQELIELVSTSKLLGNSINSILTKNVSSLLDGIGVNMNFYSVKDWKQEASKFAKVIEKLKQLPSTDFSKVDWFSLDENQINSLLTNLYQLDLFKVQKGDSSLYEDPFGNLIYKLLLNNDAISDIFGKNNFTIEDFSTVENKISGSTKSEFSSWVGTISNSGTYTYTNSNDEEITISEQTIDTDGEIYNLSHLFGIIKSTNITSSTFDYKTDLTKENFKDLLNTLSSSSPFSKMLPNILDYAFNKIGDLNLNESTSINLKLLNTNVLNTISKSEREDEIEYISDIYGMIVNDIFSSIKDAFKADSSKLEIEQDSITSIENLLNDFGKMKMSTTLKVGENIKFIDQLMSNILNISGIDQALTGVDNSLDAKTLMIPYIKQITNSTTYKWDFDINSSLSTDLRKEAVYNNSTSQILSITKILRYASESGINLNGIKGDIGTGDDSISSANLKQMLTYINQSKLMHFGMGNLFNKVFKTVNFDSYLDTGEGGKELKIDTFTHLDYSSTNVEYWQLNIDNFTLLYENISSKSGGSNSLDNISIGKGEGKVSTYDLVSPLNNMPLFDDKREYIVYNLLSKVSSSSSSFNLKNYIRPITDDSSSTTIASKALKIRNLLFNDSYTASQLKIQCDILDNIVENSSSISSSDLSGSSSDSTTVKTLGDTLFNLVLSVYNYEDENGNYLEDKVSIGYFASEVISNILVERLTAVDSSLESFFKELLFTSSDYGRDYRYLNIIEANGLKGLILLSSFNSDYFKDSTNKANSYPEFQAAFKLLGRQLESSFTGSTYYGQLTSNQIKLLKKTEQDTTLTKYYSSSSSTTKLNNSRLAIKLFNTYAKKIVVASYTLPTGATTTYYLSDIVTNAHIDFENQSFEEACGSIVTAIATIPSI